MTWAMFFQSLTFLVLGAHIYSCGKAGQSLLNPLHNLVARFGEVMSHRRQERENGHSITPNVRS